MTSSSSNSKPKRLYLITDDEFPRSYALNLLTMVLGVCLVYTIPSLNDAATDSYFAVHEWLMVTAHGYMWWSLLGLLSSSCCALQLIFNALAWGCAGFNTILGPLRPTSLAMATLMQVSSWYVAWERPWSQRKPTILSTVVVFGLALLPEVLYWYYHAFVGTRAVVAAPRQRRQQQQPSPQEQRQQESNETHTYFYRIDNVGCSACVTAVSRVLDKIDVVKHYNVSLEEGILSIHARISLDDNERIITTKLEESGFPLQPLQSHDTK